MKTLKQYINENFKISHKTITTKNFQIGHSIYQISMYYTGNSAKVKSHISFDKKKLYDIEELSDEYYKFIIAKDGGYTDVKYTEKPGIGYTARFGGGDYYVLYIDEEHIRDIKKIFDYMINNKDKFSIKEIFKILDIKNPFEDFPYTRKIVIENIDDIIKLRDNL